VACAEAVVKAAKNTAVFCVDGCTCGRHSRSTRTSMTPGTEPYQPPMFSVPHGRFMPIGDGCYKAVAHAPAE